ncbi:hypothetical protein ACH5RR_003239 [Cinchona calisaya]|uniref:RNase H type-1 domain-containing protein n=1 Tax=Cinchona calisaya TaxID=153742 RepID=A0ABD3AUD9_9GENT
MVEIQVEVGVRPEQVVCRPVKGAAAMVGGCAGCGVVARGVSLINQGSFPIQLVYREANFVADMLAKMGGSDSDNKLHF